MRTRHFNYLLAICCGVVAIALPCLAADDLQESGNKTPVAAVAYPGDPDADSEPADRAPAPDDAARRKAEKEVREIFSSYFKEATPKGRTALAAKLVAQSLGDNEPASRYAMLRMAGEIAAAAGDLATAMHAAGELGHRFAVNTISLKADLLLQLSPKLIRQPADAAQLATAGLLVMQSAANREQFADVKRLTPVVRSAATATKNQPFIAQTHETMARMDGQAAVHNQILAALEKLKTSPNDPEANGLAGRYYCFTKNDFARGVPLLAKGPDADLAQLATRELNSRPRPEETFDLANMWWTAAQKQPPASRPACEAHAREFYRRVLPWLSGLARELAQKRLTAPAYEPPAVASVAPLPSIGPVGKVSRSTKVFLIVVNDDSRCGVDLLVNGKGFHDAEHLGHNHWKHGFAFDLNPNDVIVFKTADKNTGALMFCLMDEKGNVLSYSKAGTPIAAEAKDMAKFMLGKGGIPGVVVPGEKEGKVKEAMTDSHTPKNAPPDWEAIWFSDIRQSPIYVRAYPPE